MIIGHNKILEHWIEGGNDTYFTVCTQCNRKWRMKQLSTQPHIIMKTHTIKIRAQAKLVHAKIVPKIALTQKVEQKHLVNIYLI